MSFTILYVLYVVINNDRVINNDKLHVFFSFYCCNKNTVIFFQEFISMLLFAVQRVSLLLLKEEVVCKIITMMYNILIISQ